MRKIHLSDTIAAVSTPMGKGGIGIVRLSGEKAIGVADSIFKSVKGQRLAEKKSHTISYGKIVEDKTGAVIDEVLVMLMKAPNTYTKEDVVEINCHGGFATVKKVLELCLLHGARLAEPGEFTKRAFLNGRIDLSQAEAVIDVIDAKTESVRQAAVNQLGGSLKEKVHSLRQRVLDMIASIEAAIDYPEHDIEEETYENLQKETQAVLEKVEELLSTADRGKLIKEGIKTVILGKPNVGKSSLLNAFLKENRAIVTDIPGTTRDTVEEYMNLFGVPIKLVDTAGIRETKDVVEKIGVEKSKQQAKDADLILFLLDTSRPFEKEDREILSFCEGKKTLVLFNKIDLKNQMQKEEVLPFVEEKNIFALSVLENKGMEAVIKRIQELFFMGDISMKDTIFLTNVRHKDVLEKAKEGLQKTLETIAMKMPEDFVSMDLQEVLGALGEITGDTMDEEIIDRIFTKFCLGK